MKYNIYTVLNSGYFKFALYFFYSLYETNDLSKIDRIFVLDIGMTKKERDMLSKKFSKIEFVESGKAILFDGILTHNWLQSIDQKTEHLNILLRQKNPYPIFMLDIDCLMLRDLYSLVEMDSDIVVGVRNNLRAPNRAGFMLFKTHRIITTGFMNEWLLEMRRKPLPWRESPGLSRTVPKFRTRMNIVELPAFTLTCEGDHLITDETYSAHFKSGEYIDKSPEEIIDLRIARIFERKDKYKDQVEKMYAESKKVDQLYRVKLPIIRRRKIQKEQSMKKVFIDCGANAGQSLFRFMRHFSDQAEYEVHCFDPNTDLKDNIFEKRNVNYHPTAVWTTDGKIKFYIADHHESSSVMVNKTTGQITADKYVEVDSIDLGKWIKDTFSKDDYIVLKMNIEGAEYDVLDSMLEDGSIDYVNLLVVSFHSHKLEGPYDTATLERRIKEHGVELQRWTKSLW